MNGLAVAALVTQLMVTGGAGAEDARRPVRPEASWDGVREDFTSVRKDFSQLLRAFKEARGAAKDQASQK